MKFAHRLATARDRPLPFLRAAEVEYNCRCRLSRNFDRRPAVMAHGTPEKAQHKPLVPDNGQLTPELLDWVRQQFTDEEIRAALQELRAGGGLELRDFLDELE